MNYLEAKKRAMLNSITKRRLPDEYQQVKYIESIGSQWIDTGFIPTNNTKVELDFQKTTSQIGFMFGSRKSAVERGFTIQVASAGFWYYMFSNTGKYTNIPLDMNRHVFILDRSGFSIDGNTFTIDFSVFECPANAYIFTAYNDAIPTSSIEGKCYSCRMWENDTLVRDFVPCYRKSDGEIGLYDLVTNTFYINAGTGEFIIGRLPDEYQEVEWIKGTGPQYINTGFTISSNSKIVFNAKFGQSNGWFFGIKTADPASGFAGTYFRNNNSVFDFFGSRYTFVAPDDDSWHKLDYSKNGLYIDNIQTTEESLQIGTILSSFFIFKPRVTTGSVTINIDVTLKNVEFYQNGIDLTFNYIPCYRKSDNVIGMYDLVTNTFCINSGTGEFEKGPDVN